MLFFVPKSVYDMKIQDVIDESIIPFRCCSSSRKPLLLLTFSRQPKVTIIISDIIDFILTIIGFETKLLFDGTTISLSLMLLLIVNVFASVHKSFLQLKESGEPKVT